MNDNNYERLAFAMQLRDRALNTDLVDSTPRNQRLVDCMMDDYSDINFQDPGLLGLFSLFDFDKTNLASLKIQDVIELLWSDEDGDEITLIGEMIRKPGFNELFNASRLRGGLDTVNQVLKYACFNAINLNSVSAGDLNRIDPAESDKACGNVYSIRIKVHEYDNQEEDDCVQTFWSRELYISSSFKSFINNCQVHVDRSINELLAKSSLWLGLAHHITDIVIYFNGRPFLSKECKINIDEINNTTLNILKSFPGFDVMANDEKCFEDMREFSLDVFRKIKGRVLENAMGL
jgi:hypothetical protein